MTGSIESWQAADCDDAVKLRAAVARDTGVAAIARVRKDWDAPVVACAIELTRARAKASSKWPAEIAQSIIADAQGVEMASSWAASRWKAQRFAAEMPDARVIDLCCGIGGDAMGLAQAGLEVVGVDLDPTRAWMCSRNASCVTRAADAAASDEIGDAFHLDPARRDTSGSRLTRLDDLEPGLDAIESIVASRQHGAIKLAPGVPADRLPEGELEIISESGKLTQAVLWTGRLARAERSATLLLGGESHHLSGEPGTPSIAPIGAFVHTVDPAPERAGLLHLIGLPLAHPKLGLFVSDQSSPSPWLTSFEVLEHTPWIQKRVRAWLRQHDGGIVEVKTRGKAVNTDIEQRALRGTGSTPYTVFVLRFDRAVTALITRRVRTA